MTPHYLTTQEVADHFRISATQVIRWIKAGKFPGAINIGTPKKANYRIPANELQSVVCNAERNQKMPEGVESLI
jgi:DNA-binding transcriptional regulator LsrR (DeoR family)